MKVLLTFITCTAICNCLNAQIYFESLNGEIPSGEGIGETVRVNDGYLSWCYSFGTFQSYMFTSDLEGQLLSETYFDKLDSLSYLGSYVVSLNDTCFVGLTLRENLNRPSAERGDYCLIKFGISGEVYSEWVYGDGTHRDIPQNLIRTDDGGFFISGQSQFGTPPNVDGQVYAVKVDSIGNEEWSQEYGGNLYESGGGGVQTPDGGFLLLGWTRSFGSGQRDFYLLKIDEQGSEQWSETYGTSSDEGGMGIIKLGSGSYLLTGSGANPTSSGSFGRIYQIDSNGNLGWSNTYSYSNNTSNNFWKSIELPDGSLLSVGATGGTGSAGWLVKTNEMGEELWQREYDLSSQTDLLINILATDDGGFLLSGQAINEQTNSQDAWLLKVDSVGCPYPNCTVGIDEEAKTVVVDVWPNPATDVLNIEKVGSSKHPPQPFLTLTESWCTIILRTTKEKRLMFRVGLLGSMCYKERTKKAEASR